jgi:hypothetical protein
MGIENKLNPQEGTNDKLLKDVMDVLDVYFIIIFIYYLSFIIRIHFDHQLSIIVIHSIIYIINYYNESRKLEKSQQIHSHQYSKLKPTNSPQ